MSSTAAGPNAWMEMVSSSCSGLNQSPIDIQTATMNSGGPVLEFDYQDVTLEVVNDGHVLEVPYTAGSELRVNGEVYTLEKVQFHTMSEHLYLGKQYDMEAHLVHRNAAGQTAIVAVFLDGGALQNSFVGPAISNAPEIVTTNATLLTVNARDLLPTSSALTTSSVDMPMEYSPVAYSPLSQAAYGYTPVAHSREEWKEKKKDWKEAWKDKKKEWKETWSQIWKDMKSSMRRSDYDSRSDYRKAKREARAKYKEERRASRDAMRAQRKQSREDFRQARRDEHLGNTEPPPANEEPPVPDPEPTPEPPASSIVQVDTYFEYMGSLTMPNCDGNVRWFVLPAVVNVSSASVAEMQRIVGMFPNYDGYPYNYRPVQPLYNKQVFQVEPAL
ncbi:MAG: carbonic anhydrase family protein [Gammaproteobacteria bacterium]|nr:carbonic anhydrase family protein [Gammaproteobacteria bacterium]